MRVLYTDDPPFSGASGMSNGLFLAGPTPRSKEVESWRPAAIKFLESMSFVGTVIVPERRDRTIKIDYMDQVEWEDAGLCAAQGIVFWVPRDLTTLPGFTTNVEFGRFVGRRSVYGRPENAPKTRYLDWLYTKTTKRVPCKTLEDTLKEVLSIYWF